MVIPRGCEPREGVPISLVAIHTAEGATTVESLAHFLDEPGREDSYHVLVDDHTTLRYLTVSQESQACWAMLSGNHRALQLCFTGFAAWPRSEWLSHDNMLRMGARVVADWCARYRIPVVKLTPAQVGADRRGICGHWDWTIGKRDGTHTDPGPNFPWDVFIGYVQALGADMQPDERDVLFGILTQLSGPGPTWGFAGWPARPDDTTKPKTLVDYIRAVHAAQLATEAKLDALAVKIDKLAPKP